jgi:hypothetical protein
MSGNIDFSQVDLILGVVIGAAGLVVVGFLFWRAGVVKFSWERSGNSKENPSAFAEIKTMIGDLRIEIKEYVREHQECQRQLPEKYVSWDVLNHRIIDKLEEDRKRRWAEFDRHRHDPNSGVVIKV